MTDVTDRATEAELEADMARRYQARLVWEEPGRAEARASAEPMPMYAALLEQSPVLHHDDGNMTLLSMEDILYVNKHREVEQASKFLGSNRPAIPLGLDGPVHTRYRRLLDPVFTAKRVALLAPRVRALADQLIDGFLADGEVDAYERWCEPLPSTIFLSIMGLPLDDLDQFLHFKNLTLSSSVQGSVSPEEKFRRRNEAVAWIQDYFNRDLDRREASDEPGDDMLGWLLTTQLEGERLSRSEVLDILGLLMIAGLDTVAASLSCFLSFLARHPGHRAQVVADPSLWPTAVEELMRYESPVADGSRLAMAELDLPSGTHVEPGTVMGLSWHAANLDPAAFEDPLVVDFSRHPNRHIGFASGWHRCLGSHLARMEMVVAMEAWHARIPDYQIAEGAELVYSGNPRAPHHLPLKWG